MWNGHVIDLGIRNFMKNYTAIREEAEWSLNREFRDNCLDNTIK